MLNFFATVSTDEVVFCRVVELQFPVFPFVQLIRVLLTSLYYRFSPNLNSGHVCPPTASCTPTTGLTARRGIPGPRHRHDGSPTRRR